jgi:hypothetical protein
MAPAARLHTHAHTHDACATRRSPLPARTPCSPPPNELVAQAVSAGLFRAVTCAQTTRYGHQLACPPCKRVLTGLLPAASIDCGKSGFYSLVAHLHARTACMPNLLPCPTSWLIDLLHCIWAAGQVTAAQTQVAPAGWLRALACNAQPAAATCLPSRPAALPQACGRGPSQRRRRQHRPGPGGTPSMAWGTRPAGTRCRTASGRPRPLACIAEGHGV